MSKLENKVDVITGGTSGAGVNVPVDGGMDRRVSHSLIASTVACLQVASATDGMYEPFACGSER